MKKICFGAKLPIPKKLAEEARLGRNLDCGPPRAPERAGLKGERREREGKKKEEVEKRDRRDRGKEEKATNGYRGERKRAREKGRNCVTSYLKATSRHEVPRRIAPVQSFGVQTPARPRGHKPQTQHHFLRTPYVFFGEPHFFIFWSSKFFIF